MRTIFIEPVSNGWIVRLHDSSREYISQPIAVYNSMIDLQTDLPMLLESGGQDYSRGGDRRPETIGGKELCPSA